MFHRKGLPYKVMNQLKHKIKKNLSLKKVYYLSFLVLIVIPILVILIVALLILNQQFKEQAVENIQRAQENIITELKADIDSMSMRLSHLVYTNNNEILKYAAQTETNNKDARYEAKQLLEQSVNMALEPVKEIVSVGFYMKNGNLIHVKRDINRTAQEIKKNSWYQSALLKSNTVCVGSYDTASTNDLFSGGKRDMLILVYALAPDVTTDRSQKIEVVAFYQASDAAEKIKTYNQAYTSGRNKLGITRIMDEKGNLVFSTKEDRGDKSKDKAYTCVRTPIQFIDTTWYIESDIETVELTSEFWRNAVWVLGSATLILLLAAYFFGYFLKSIVKPVEEISSGLRQVEEGNLEVHLVPTGQNEIRNMIHQFNAMVRRLKALIGDYEERVRSIEKSPADYFAEMIRHEMTPEEVNQISKEFFAEKYAILCFYMDYYNAKENELDYAEQVVNSFIRNPRFASRCIYYKDRAEVCYVLYRITEEEYHSSILKMVSDIQKNVNREFRVHLAVCIGIKQFGYSNFTQQIEYVRTMLELRHIKGVDAVIHLEEEQELMNEIWSLSAMYHKLSDSLYIADEKNVVQEREKLMNTISNISMEEAKVHAYAVIVMIGIRFSMDNVPLAEVFGQQFSYFEKISRINDIRSLRLWITNYLAWIMDYASTRLEVSETDMIVKAKRYLTEHYEDPELSLSDVASYVELNEKYFTNRFTKETGETFSTYVTELRMQKARELLKTTSFKVYEVAEMSGYHNVEHFNRMFKKLNGVSPAQYRKTM